MPHRSDKKWSALLAEARELGLHYLGNDIAELRNIVDQERAVREGKPDCYSQSYSRTDPRCGRCEASQDCSGLMLRPQIGLFDVPEMIGCDWCDGDLIMELTDDTGAVIDRACSSPDCHNTARNQRRRRTVTKFLKSKPTGADLAALREDLWVTLDNLAAVLQVDRARLKSAIARPDDRLSKETREAFIKWVKRTTIL